MTLVLNGWAAAPEAWGLCTFPRAALFSYTDQLAGAPEAYLAAHPSAPGVRDLVLVGWSMGGSSALRLACRVANRLAGLVLVAATPRMMAEPETGWRGLSPRRLEALHQSIRLTHGQGFFALPPDKPNPFMLDAEEHLADGIRYLLETDLRTELERTFAGRALPFPVFIFHSERDGVVRPENAAWLGRVFSGSAVTYVPGTEHALPIFIPGLIDGAVNRCAVR